MNSPLRYHGGKTYLAKQIVALMPPHTRYCETHFGGGAVLFTKDPEGISEFANDINGELTNFWQTLQCPLKYQIFQRYLEAIPLSTVEFKLALEGREAGDVARACDFFVRNRQSRQGLGESYCTPTSRTRRGMNENVSAWLNAVEGLPEVHARLRRVEVRNQDAREFIQQLDSESTLFYVDPPYLPSTRSSKEAYGQHEMTEQQHETLLHVLHRIKGKFLLSGYKSAMYEKFAAVANWWRVEWDIDNKASSKSTKPTATECVWSNYEISPDKVLGGRLYPTHKGVRPGESQGAV